MKKRYLILAVFFYAIHFASAQVAINTNGATPVPSAMLEVSSSTKGFLPPRLTTQQRDAISNPATGLVIYNSEVNCLEFYSGPPAGWITPCQSQVFPDCYNIELHGTYLTGTQLTSSNFITLPLTVAVPGGYHFFTPTINGYSFSVRGTFTASGAQTVSLQATGIPEVEGIDEFTLSVNGNLCYIPVNVSQAPDPGFFRSGIFLHHSTGGNIWGPNGSSTSVPQEIAAYNQLHGYAGNNAVSMNEEWWSPSDNEWYTQHLFFEDPSPITGIGYYLPDNKIIVVKTCFPASSMSGAGQPQDTLSPWVKSLYNYKWHWRHIIHTMAQHPDNFFAIWTNAPLEPYSTNASEALLSKQFCQWAKDTLAAGLDPIYGDFPQNVYVFDFFSKLTGPNGMMLPGYAAGQWDSHPNAAATQLVAPQFVSEIFNAAISYEAILNDHKGSNP